MENPTIECEIRFADDPSRQSPGRLTGTLVTYGERARNLAGGYRRWRAMYWDDGGIIINEQHQRGRADSTGRSVR